MRLLRHLKQAVSRFLRQCLLSHLSRELPCRQMIDRVFPSCPSSWLSATWKFWIILSRIGFRLSYPGAMTRVAPKTCKERLETIIGQRTGEVFDACKPATAYEVCVLRLVDCPRTRDEDVHESSGALLPVRTGRHVGDADKGAEQIEWLQISTNVAALDCALHQRINRSLDLTA